MNSKGNERNSFSLYMASAMRKDVAREAVSRYPKNMGVVNGYLKGEKNE